ncbi:hypothetical protein TCAL_15766 [Tigriopus californicus]|uniref:Uncharacterized protein n=1 Tax=Tigriopus californicus TaxID=6832 RepID=A0A553P787_TIGCA|nr:uncharacterized protein LOC131877722 [Tigriopus californicus]TRY73551.1 hypothetical protein TCAL_15766 [Tigriopus californicus]
MDRQPQKFTSLCALRFFVSTRYYKYHWSMSHSPPKVQLRSPRSIQKARKASMPSQLCPVAIGGCERPNLFWLTVEEYQAFQDLFQKEMVQSARSQLLKPFLPNSHLGIWLAFLDKGDRWHRVKIDTTPIDTSDGLWQCRDLDSAQIYVCADPTRFYQIPSRWKDIVPQSILLEIPNLVPIKGSLSMNTKVWQFRSQTWSPQAFADVQDLIQRSLPVKAHFKDYTENQFGYNAQGELFFQEKDGKALSLTEFLVSKGHAKVSKPMKIRTSTPEPETSKATITYDYETNSCVGGKMVNLDHLGDHSTLTDWLIENGKTTYLDLDH